MKKILFIILMAMPCMVFAQKFGYINTQEVFAQMPDVKIVQSKLDSIGKSYENQIASMREELARKYQEYQEQQSTMTDALKQLKEQEIYDMQQRSQTFVQQVQQDYERQQQELLAPVHEKLSSAIKKVGEEKGFTYIFDSAAMVYIAPDAVNVASDVKAKLGIK
ncbi:MAG: OmpH family outer membrane protein [Paludibacteraceae bacterium]|nr:OmpH family outer membrane protein [Paludibacteraceae bacterium]